ncbi:hypothetical protein [Minwuia sp.]|uniref:hypothetical protein n=1 Tax=Minwuia sp. TaxID=2493630 RepID=UPI003A92F248
MRQAAAWELITIFFAALGVVLISFPASPDEARSKPDNDDLTIRIVSHVKQVGENQSINRINEPAIGSLMQRRYRCLRSNATGNRERGFALSDDLGQMLGGPPNPSVVIDDRYWLGHACRLHSCSEAAAMIVDMQAGLVHFAMLHYYQWYNSVPQWREPLTDGYLSILIDPATPVSELSATARIAMLWSSLKRGPSRPELRPSLYQATCVPESHGSGG